MAPHELFSAHLDGYELSASERRELSAWIASDPQNAAMLVDMAWIHEQLDHRLSVPRLLEQFAQTGDPQIREGIRAAIRGVESLRLDPTVPRPAHDRQRRATGTRVALALAACLLIAVGLVPLAYQWQRAPDTGDLARNTLPPVAAITAAIDVPAGDHSFDLGEPLYPQQWISLPKGIVQFTTNDGTKLVVEGPAQFRANDPLQWQLRSGKLTARVENHHQLVIDTPTARVTDLGTEFGVGVSATGATDVAVYEGRVRLESSVEGTASAVRELTANRAGYVDRKGLVRSTIRTLPHDREFIRPDEVTLLVAGRDGSPDAVRQSLHYRLQRVAGLLGVQPLDRPAQGEAMAFTFLAPKAAGADVFLVDNLVSRPFDDSAALRVVPDHPVTIPLDSAIEAPLMRAGLLDDRMLVGRSGTEVWLTWRSQSEPAPRGAYSGLSLMFGNQRLTQEPLFIGTADGTANATMSVNVGSRTTRHRLDTSAAPGTQALDLGTGVHHWTLRIAFGQRADCVSCWCDVPLADIANSRPHAEAVSAYIAFNRVELAVARDAGPWRFDDLSMGTTLSSLQEAAALLDE